MINHRCKRLCFDSTFPKGCSQSRMSSLIITLHILQMRLLKCKNTAQGYTVLPVARIKPRFPERQILFEGSFSWLLAAKVWAWRQITKIRNFKVQLLYLYAPQPLMALKGVAVLWLILQHSYKNLGLTKANFKPSLILSVISRVSFRRWYFYLIEGADTALLSTTDLARINPSS